MESQVTTTQTAIKWGIINAVFGIIIATLTYVFDLWKYGWASFIGIIPIAILMYLAQKEFKENNEGFMSYSQGLGIGVMMGAISGVISSIYGYIYMNFIDTELMTNIMNFQMEKMEEQGLSEQQVEAAMEMSSKFQSPGIVFVFGILGAIFVAFLVALIVSAINQKKKPVFM